MVEKGWEDTGKEGAVNVEKCKEDDAILRKGKEDSLMVKIVKEDNGITTSMLVQTIVPQTT